MALSPYPPSRISLENKIGYIYEFALNEINNVEEVRVEKLKTMWGKVRRDKEINNSLKNKKISLSSGELDVRITYWKDLTTESPDELIDAYKDLLGRANYVRSSVQEFLLATERSQFSNSKAHFLGVKTENLLNTVLAAVRSEDLKEFSLLKPVISSFFDLQIGALVVRKCSKESSGLASSKEYRMQRSQVASAASSEGGSILRAMLAGAISKLPPDQKTTSLDRFLDAHYEMFSGVLEEYKRIFHSDGTGVHYGKNLKPENFGKKIKEWAKEHQLVRAELSRVAPKCKFFSATPGDSCSGEQRAEDLDGRNS